MHIPPPVFSEEERVAMGVRCRDCDPVPKVLDAGMVVVDAEGRRIQIMHNGLRVLADGYYGKWMTDLIRLCRGHHESQEERLFHEVVKCLPTDATMIELGGFWSYYSLWFLMNQPGRRSLVIEPEPTHLAVGQANAAINGLAPKFLAGFAGATFSVEEPFECEASGIVPLPRYSVQHLMAAEGWSRLTPLHCDTQGAETDVLASCRDMFLARQIDWVFVSTHAHQISGDVLTHQRCLAMLRECGAIIEAEHDVHESFSGDGLIVARFSAPTDWVPVESSANRHSQSLFRHLAYDLDESMRAQLAAETELNRLTQVERTHPVLRQTGRLYALESDGPLGRMGDTLILPDDEVMSPGVRADGHWEIANVEAFAARLQSNKSYTLIDIGANIGLFSRQLSTLSPAIEKFLCVEPDPNNFKALAYNLAFAGDRAQLFNLALCAHDEEGNFFRDSHNIGNYSLNPDAMRERPHDSIRVQVRAAGNWLSAHLHSAKAIAWKSDTQGMDEVIAAAVPMSLWSRIDVALLEMWRIAKPDYDRAAFRERIECFPNRQLGEQSGVTANDVMDYVAGGDRQFLDLLLWR